MARFPFLSEPLENGALNLCLMGLLAPVMNEENKDELLHLVCDKSKLEASKALSNWSLAAQKPSPEIKNENRENQSLLPESKLRFIKPKLEVTPTVASTLSGTSCSKSSTNEATQKVSPGYFEIKIAADAELMTLIQAAQEKLSNKNPQGTPLTEVLKQALQEFVENKNVKNKTKAKRKPALQKSPKASSVINKTPDKKPQSRYIPKPIVKMVNQRAAGQCEFVSPVNQKRCDSKWDLELHHQIPYAAGGSHDVQNIKKICRQHNFQAAVIDFGYEKMSAYRRQAT